MKIQGILGAEPAPLGTYCWSCNRSAVSICPRCRRPLCEHHYLAHRDRRQVYGRCSRGKIDDARLMSALRPAEPAR